MVPPLCGVRVIPRREENRMYGSDTKDITYCCREAAKQQMPGVQTGCCYCNLQLRWRCCTLLGLQGAREYCYVASTRRLSMRVMFDGRLQPGEGQSVDGGTA